MVVRRPTSGTSWEYLLLHQAVDGAGIDVDRAWTCPTGPRYPGESVYPGALRALGEVAGITGAEVWAVDLSRRSAVFGCEIGRDRPVTLPDPAHDRFAWVDAEALARMLPAQAAARLIGASDRIPSGIAAFRPMSRADFPDLVRWQAQPHVATWWHNETPDVATAERRYGPAIDGGDPTRLWVVEVHGRSVGFVQDYLIGDHPDYAILTGAPDAVGFDYAIGDRSWVGRGWGTRMLWTFLRDVVRPRYPDSPACFAAPDHRNLGSLRVLDKLGFVRGLWFDEPQRDGGVDTVVSCTLDVQRIFG